MKRPKFNIGDEVYHVTPESDKGIVIEVNYSYAFDANTYLVSLGFGVQHECAEHELSEDKLF
jgi:hypothetical protein